MQNGVCLWTVAETNIFRKMAKIFLTGGFRSYVIRLTARRRDFGRERPDLKTNGETSMSFDAKIQELIEALDRNTAALEAAGSGGGGSTKPEGTSGKGGASGKAGGASGKGGKKVTEEDVKAMAVALKDKFGTAEAKKIIKSAGKANQLADIEEANYAAFVKAGQAKLDEADNGGDGDDGEDGL